MQTRQLVAIVLILLCVGCTAKEQPAPVAPPAKVVRFNVGSDFRSLDPQLIADTTSSAGAYQLFDGLVRLGTGGVQPAVAQRWEIGDNGRTYTFYLRDNAKWSNGEPVKATDFVFAWTRGLLPETGSEYATQLYYIKGGRAVNQAKDAATLAEAVKNLGVKALDDQRLQVTLESPAPYWIQLLATPTYFPVNQRTVASNRAWAAKPESLVSNGPFKLQSWAPKQEAVFVKNPAYWNAANVKLNQLIFTFVEEQSTALQLWESGQLEMMQSPPPAELIRLRKENQLQFAPTFGTYYYFFNLQQRPFADPRVRRALSMAIDRKGLVENVTRAGQRPATGWVPYGARDENEKDFRETAGDLVKLDVEGAKKLLAEAGYPNGQGLPATELLYNTSEGHKAVAEAVIEMWRQHLGITSIRATNLEWKVLLDRTAKGDFSMARSAWTGDFLDPMTFLEVFTTGNGQNGGRYSNKRYDDLVAQAKSTDDQRIRMPAMREAESILMAEMPLIPVYFYTMPFLLKPKVTGVFQNGLGVVDFTNADIS
ncbi:MAG TPA: ABC transporter substrate-binding protein [Symbiobacteriaceae bacterium]|nr:ABC transporter substrate-binding protein [Symbiobacteriaceae bacterium]